MLRAALKYQASSGRQRRALLIRKRDVPRAAHARLAHRWVSVDLDCPRARHVHIDAFAGIACRLQSVRGLPNSISRSRVALTALRAVIGTRLGTTSRWEYPRVPHCIRFCAPDYRRHLRLPILLRQPREHIGFLGTAQFSAPLQRTSGHGSPVDGRA